MGQDKGIDTVRVTVSQGGYAFVPSAFSPNGDGRNDMLRAQVSGYNFISFSIFNRPGNKVFESNNIHTSWDGRYKGEEAASDVYFWLLRLKNTVGEDAVVKGDVTLIR